MNRRELLKRWGTLVAAGMWAPSASVLAGGGAAVLSSGAEGQIMTVTGPIAPEEAGAILPHEHVIDRFGEPPARRPDYDLAQLFETVVPRLEHVKALGCGTIVDCTAAYFGRDPLIMKQLAALTDLRLVTNTGYYGAAEDRYIPQHAYDETADQLADRWLREWTEGVDGTGIRPGFIKTAVDAGPLSDIEHKLIRAAARTHRESGLTMAVHTSGNVTAAREQMDVLRDEGIAPEAWIWVHAHNVEDPDALAEAGERGAWLSFDGLQPDTVERHLELVRDMKRRGLLERVLLSHDGTSFPPGDVEPRPYHTLFETFIPELKASGFSDAEVRMLTVDNPRRAFTVSVRT